ncbi:CPBP family glutamic-type intramembrane protease [Propionibacteriaceae bacterium Y1685]
MQVRSRPAVVLGAVVGMIMLAVALRMPPGTLEFLLLSIGLALVWAVAGVLGARPAVGRTRAPSAPRLALAGVLAGGALVLLFVLGALLVRWIPRLADPVSDLLAHGAAGAFWPVLGITVGNAVAEEIFFRGAVYAALPDRFAVVGTIVAYTVITAASGIWLLVLAGFLLGIVTTLQRRATGGVLAPAVTHLVWSTSMLLFLPALV